MRPSTPNLVGSEPKVSEKPVGIHYQAKPPATTVKELERMADNLTRSMNRDDDDGQRFAAGTNGNSLVDLSHCQKKPPPLLYNPFYKGCVSQEHRIWLAV